MGLPGRAFGLTLDNVVALTIVTADGRRRRVDATHDPDLFWALRGGGGSFGVVTDFTLRTHRVRRASWCSVTWPAAAADAALQAWLAFAPDADPSLTMILTIAGGRVSALGQYLGSEATLRRLLRPLATVPGAAVRTGTAGWLDLQRRWAGCLDSSLRACHTTGTRPGGRLPRERFAASSLYLGGAQDAAARRALLRASQPRGGATGTLLLDAYGGAIAVVDAGATAFVHRDVRCSIQVLSYATGALGWVAAARAAIAPHATRRRVPELRRPGDQGLARCLLRRRLRAAGGDQAPRGPRRPLPVRAVDRQLERGAQRDEPAVLLHDLAVGGEAPAAAQVADEVPVQRGPLTCRRSRGRSARARGGRCRRSSRRRGSCRSARSMPKFVPMPSSPRRRAPSSVASARCRYVVAALGASPGRPRRRAARARRPRRRRPRGRAGSCSGRPSRRPRAGR